MNGLRNETEERGGGKLLEPNTILPIQFFSQRGTSRWTGEQRLMAAILEDAIAVYSKSSAPKGSKARQVLRETERWLRSRDRTWTFSFLRVCEMLSLDPVAILRALRERRDRQSAQVAESRDDSRRFRRRGPVSRCRRVIRRPAASSRVKSRTAYTAIAQVKKGDPSSLQLQVFRDF